MKRIDALVRRGMVAEGVPLAPFTTYKLGGDARWYAEVADRDHLRTVLAAKPDDVPVLVLGRGSNIVVSDHGFAGLAIRLVGEFVTLRVSGSGNGDVDAGAGVNLPRLARESVAQGRGGLEWLIGIPGSVGGAIRMNAGGYGSDTRKWLVHAAVLDTDQQTETTWDVGQLGLGYRTSALTDREIVLSARFRTVAQPEKLGRAKLRKISRWRRDHQPGGTLNAGSAFKNPPGDAAGRIIDDLGLKGFKCGGASVSDKHANFFVAAPGATSQDVYDLVHEVRSKVAAATGINLEPEVRFTGAFVDRPTHGSIASERSA